VSAGVGVGVGVGVSVGVNLGVGAGVGVGHDVGVGVVVGLGANASHLTYLCRQHVVIANAVGVTTPFNLRRQGETLRFTKLPKSRVCHG